MKKLTKLKLNAINLNDSEMKQLRGGTENTPENSCKMNSEGKCSSGSCQETFHDDYYLTGSCGFTLVDQYAYIDASGKYYDCKCITQGTPMPII